MQLFCGKNRTPYLQLDFQFELSAIAILSSRNIPSMQHYVLLILRHSRLARKSLRAFFARYAVK